MFTGIIDAVGRIRALEPVGGDLRIEVCLPGARPQDPDSAGAATASSYTDLRLGESIAVSGVCLTVTAFDVDSFSADVSRETLARTTLGGWQAGTVVNLERAMLPTTRFGGHMVAGHVDGVGRVLAVQADARSQRWRVQSPAALMRYIAEKGSIAVDGVSLTVNAVGADWFEVNLVPHTVAHTAFAATAIAAPVNLEVDLVARYVERLFAGRTSV